MRHSKGRAVARNVAEGATIHDYAFRPRRTTNEHGDVNKTCKRKQEAYERRIKARIGITLYRKPCCMDPLTDPSAGDLWVFGYGSLMWRPGFDYVERLDARLI